MTANGEKNIPFISRISKMEWQRSSLQAHNVDISLQNFCAVWSQGLNNEYRSIKQPWCPSPDRQTVSSLGPLESWPAVQIVRRFQCSTLTVPDFFTCSRETLRSAFRTASNPCFIYRREHDDYTDDYWIGSESAGTRNPSIPLHNKKTHNDKCLLPLKFCSITTWGDK